MYSYLRLGKDCRSLSYNTMTVPVSLRFTRYMFLAVEQREFKYDRSIGELFYLSIDELPDAFYNVFPLAEPQFSSLDAYFDVRSLSYNVDIFLNVTYASISNFLNLFPDLT